MGVLRCSPWAPEGFESKKKRGKHGPVLLGGVIGVSTHQLPRGAGDAWLAPSTHFALRTDRGAQHRVPVPPPKDAGGEWDAGGGHGGGTGLWAQPHTHLISWATFASRLARQTLQKHGRIRPHAPHP